METNKLHTHPCPIKDLEKHVSELTYNFIFCGLITWEPASVTCNNEQSDPSYSTDSDTHRNLCNSVNC